MIKNNVYSMNSVSTFTEDDFKNALEINKELAKNKKLMSELDRLEAEAIIAESLRLHKQDPIKIIKKPESEKKSFYNYGVYFRSENAPDVYKLSGDLSTFDEQDIEFNSFLPQRVLNDYLENQRRKYIDELSNKDLLKNPFGTIHSNQEKTKDQLDEDVSEVPKPPPKAPKKWVRFVDEEGDEYFHNIVTGVTQWKKPDKFEDI